MGDLIVSCVIAVMAIGLAMLFFQLNRIKKESFVEQLLVLLREQSSTLSAIAAPPLRRSPIERMRITNALLTMDYTWPVGQNTLGLPYVLSGVLTGVTEINGRKFSYVEFTIAHGRECVFPHRESFSYEIALKEYGGAFEDMEHVEGIIAGNTLRTSMHVTRFVEIVVALHGRE